MDDLGLGGFSIGEGQADTGLDQMEALLAARVGLRAVTTTGGTPAPAPAAGPSVAGVTPFRARSG